MLHHQLHPVEDSGCHTLALSSCSNLPTSICSLAPSTFSLPVHVPPHCFPPGLIQIYPVLGKFLPPGSFDRNRRFLYPIFVRNMSTRPCPVHCAKYEHKTVSRALHGSTCAPHEDDQFDCPSCTFSFCLFCYFFKAFDQDIMLSSRTRLPTFSVILPLV